MTYLRSFSVAATLVLAMLPQAMALEAVVEVGEEAWFTSVKAATFNNASLTRFYAPLPVFFEGWKSTPREDIVDWVWDFGDGSPLFHGFNAAHVYERPGNYTAKLTVIDEEGHTAQATMPIEALASTGTTYYVDSAIGDDANAGTSPQAPWRTATQAFGGMNQKRYKPGDRVLFQRGQTFDLEAGVVRPAGGMSGYGYYFGAYGEGPKPIIKHVGTSNLEMIKIGNSDLAFWGIMDLEFDCRSAEGTVSSFFICTARACNIFFLRTDVHHHFQAVGVNGDHLSRVITNVYLIGCNVHDSVGVDAMHLYSKAARYANIDSTFDMCDDHVGYHAYLNKAIFSGNVYTRWAFGRLCIRVCGVSDMAHPSNNVHILNNRFQGWIDPKIDTWAHTGRGVRYNLCAVELGPNKGSDQWMYDGIIENNVFKDVEKFIEVGDWENVIVRNNTMTTVSTAAGNHRIQIGHPFEHKPLKNLRIYNNTIVSNEQRAGAAGIFYIGSYTWTPYNGISVYEDVSIEHNRITIQGGDVRLITCNSDNALQRAEVTSNANVVYGVPQTMQIFQVGGTYNSPLATYTLGEWRALTGSDRATLILSSDQTPLPGAADSPASCDSTPILVDYEGALCTNGSGLKAVHLWAKKDDAPWARTGLSSTAGEGTFLFTGVNGNGNYFFATQAEDNNGGLSPQPDGMGHTTTAYWEAGSVDSTPPTPAVVSAPAVATAVPVRIAYTGAADAGSGVKAVHLWVCKNDGPWADSGMSFSAASGSFDYAGLDGDGAYHFATRVEDNAGNVSPEPTGTGDATTVFDTTPPAAGTLDAPGFIKSAPITVAYSGAGDGGSGLSSVTLWVRKDAGSWASSGLTQASSSGSFTYPPSGSGTYYFDLVAVDNAGLSSAAPSGNGQGYIVYDVDPPTVGALTAPASTDHTPIPVAYSGAQDALSGLKAVHLWYKKGLTGTWTPSGLSSAAPAGSFDFSGVSGSGTYYFAVQAEDNGGNVSAVPSGDGGGATAFEPVFVAGTASAPAYDTVAPVTVNYSGAYTSNGSIARVGLWYKRDAAGAWTDSGLSSTAVSGAFSFAPPADGTYYFATRAENNFGERTAVPSGAGDCNTVFDTAAPVAGTLSSPAVLNTAPISVSFSGASDSGSGLASVALWVRKGSGAWTNTGLSQSGPAGSFNYNPPSGSGSYAFALVARDRAGLTSATPSGAGMSTTVYDVDAPTPGAVTAPATADTPSLTLNYSGAGDSDSGLKAVCLWYKKGAAGTWTQTALSSTAGAGSFSFAGFSGSDTYYFATQAEDRAGNLSAAPDGNGSASTVYTGQVSAGLVSSPAYAATAPITVTYSGAVDYDSGLKAVYLWFKKGAAGAWTLSGLSATGGSGSFTFAAVSGDDTYYFATQAENNTGRLTPEPTGDGQTRTVYDTTQPVPGSLTAPALTNRAPLALAYSGASDAGSGLASVSLWVRKDAGGWTDTGLAGADASGAFSYSPQGSGVYRFALVARDRAGIASPAPGGDGFTATTYDIDLPLASTVTVPASADRKPIHIDYSGVTDALSGLKVVRLWVRKGTAGTWAPTSLTSTGESGSFDFAETAGSATYFFDVQADDNAGNASAAPSGNGKAQTVYQRTVSAGTVSAPQYATAAPIAVSYSGASDSAGAVRSVRLWYKKGAMGSWTDSGLSSADASGTFNFTAVSGDDTYYLATQAENDEGDRSPAPAGDGTARTVFDTTAPNPGTVQAPRAVNKFPLVVSYSGVTDAGSGVKQVALWVKDGRTGVWSDTGLRSTTAPNGQFQVSNLARDGKYFFFTQVEDKAGNKSAAPTDANVFGN